MADIVTNRGKFRLGTGGTVWTSATIKAGLLKSSAAPTADDNFVADVVAGSAEISVSGYARVTVTSPTATENDTNDRLELDCADLVFAGLAAGQTVGWVFIYHEVTNDADSPVLALLDIADTPTNGGDLTIQISANGAITLT